MRSVVRLAPRPRPNLWWATAVVLLLVGTGVLFIGARGSDHRLPGPVPSAAAERSAARTPRPSTVPMLTALTHGAIGPGHPADPCHRPDHRGVHARAGGGRVCPGAVRHRAGGLVPPGTDARSSWDRRSSSAMSTTTPVRACSSSCAHWPPAMRWMSIWPTGSPPGSWSTSVVQYAKLTVPRRPCLRLARVQCPPTGDLWRNLRPPDRPLPVQRGRLHLVGGGDTGSEASGGPGQQAGAEQPTRFRPGPGRLRLPPFLGRPLHLRRLRPSLLGGTTEAVLRTLRGDAADRPPHLPPAHPLAPGRLGRGLAQPLGRSSEQIGIAERSQ